MNKGIRLIKYIIIFFTLILWYPNIFAYETCKTSETSGGKDIKWTIDDTTYFINTSGGPSDSLYAIEAGMQTWTNVGSSSFTFVSGGTTTSTAHGTNDGTNIVTFDLLEVGTVAENRFWYLVSTGRLLDSDIRFNTYYSWSINGSSGTFDVQNVGTHEHGHSLCLADLYDSADSEKTMYGYVSFGEIKKRTLHKDDIDGITYLYTCPNLSVRIVDVPPVYYSTLQAAYDDSGDGDTIQSQSIIFNEDLYIDLNKSVTLEGGYNCDYTSNTGITIINGTTTISNGTLAIDNFVLE